MNGSNTLQAPAASSTNNDPTPAYGSGMNQVGSGPAALLYTLSNELIMIYSELQALYSSITQAETSVQKDTITAGADAQRSAASQQANALYCQAAGSIASGIVSVGTTVATGMYTKTATTELNTQEAQLKSLNNMDTMSQKVAMQDPDVVVTNRTELETPDVKARALELKNGDFASTQFKELNEAQMDDLNEKAISSMKRETELKNFRSNLQSKIDNQTKTINNIHSGIQSNTTRVSGIGQMFSGFTTGAASAAQASYTAQAGEEQAAQQVNQAVSQLANSTSETTRQNLGKYYDAIAGLIAAARQGAQAYAQT